MRTGFRAGVIRIYEVAQGRAGLYDRSNLAMHREGDRTFQAPGLPTAFGIV